jgi:toxin ParE1/3/4
VDLAAILDTSQDRWGKAASGRYEALLEAAVQSIAADPEGPLARERAEIFPGLRSFHLMHARRGHGVKAPVHVVYFRINRSGTVEILRVLDERTEPSLHVAPRRSR